MIDQLKAQIQGVANLRQEYARAKITRQEAYEKWQGDHQGLLSAEHNLGELLNNAERDLRLFTLRVYNETGNKTPAPGVGIRETTQMRYDPLLALDWAIKHTMALQLDKKAFEKIAEVSQPPLDFVEVAIMPQATIATDLDKALNKVAESTKEGQKNELP